MAEKKEHEDLAEETAVQEKDASDKGSSVWVDKETLRKLGVVSRVMERSKAGQVRIWTNNEYARLKKLHLLPDETEG